MSMRRSWLALIGVLIAGPVLWAGIRHVQRGEYAITLLHECVTAHRHVSYAGEVGWNCGQKRKALAVRHDAEGGRSRYAWKKGKWPPLTVPRPSIRMGDPAGWCLDEEALLRSYRVRVDGAARHLDRPAQLLVVEPRLAGRPRVEVVVDRETRLALKVTTFKPDGEVYRVAAFSRIEIGPQEIRVRPGKWGVDKFLGKKVPLEAASATAGYGIRVPDYLPDGFQVSSCRVNRRWGGKVWMSFTDGVTSFDLNQSRVPTPAQLETRFARRMGPERAARMVRWSIDRRLRRTLAEGAEDGVAVVRHKSKRKHRKYELRVDDLEISLIARADIDPEECLRVLRSLRPQ
jgi:hypothetical protein